MRRKLNALFLLLFGGVFGIFSFAHAQTGVYINEIAWMGTLASANDEWIELYNSTSESISFEGWRLEAEDGAPSIALSGSIAAGSYFLLERTDDTTTSESADLIYTGALSNSGESLRLIDPSSTTVDSVSSWYAGDNTSRSTMERVAYSGSESTQWATNDGVTTHGTDSTGNGILGTLGIANSNGTIDTEEPDKPEEQDIPDDTEEISVTPIIQKAVEVIVVAPVIAYVGQEVPFTLEADDGSHISAAQWNFGDGTTASNLPAAHTYQFVGTYVVNASVSFGNITSEAQHIIKIIAGQVVISEFMPDPEGKDGDNEWVELYNNSDQAADIGGWELDDADGGSKAFTIPYGTIVLPKSHLVFGRAVTKLALNNNTDEVRLYTGEGILIDSIEYSGSKSGIAAARRGENVYWTQYPTPGSSNVIFMDGVVKSSPTDLEESDSVQNPPDTEQTTQESNEPISVKNTPSRNNLFSFGVASAYAVEMPTPDVMDKAVEANSRTYADPPSQRVLSDSRSALRESLSKNSFEARIADIFAPGEGILLISIILASLLLATSLVLSRRKY